jgi:predicted HicB family RNase H-like nuclease
MQRKRQTGGAVSEVSRANLNPANKRGTAEQTEQLGLRLPKSVKRKALKNADALHVSVSEYVRRLIEADTPS